MDTSARQTATRSVSDALIALRQLERRSTSGGNAAHGVTPAQGAVVHEVALGGVSGSNTNTLASRLGISASAVTQLIDGLVESKILRRESDLEDRRRVRILLTDHGRKLYARFDGARIAQTATLLQALDDHEVDQLATLLAKITTDK